MAFVGFNVNPTALTMEEGRVLAAQTAEKTWPGSGFVAGVARYAASAHGVERPEKLTYYYRNAEGEVLRISFVDADRLAVEVREYESEDQIDFTTLKELPAGLISYETPLTRAEQGGGLNYMRSRPNYLVRVTLSWPNDREAPLYSVTYGSESGAQINPQRICCFDAKTGAIVGSAVAPHVDVLWPVPHDCEVSSAVYRQIERFQGFFVDGPALSIGIPIPPRTPGRQLLQLVGGQGTARLESAVNTEDPSAQAELVNTYTQPTTTGVVAVSFATLRLPVPGCWNVKISVGGAVLEYTLYAHPWECRPQHAQFPPLPGVTPLPCVRR